MYYKIFKWDIVQLIQIVVLLIHYDKLVDIDINNRNIFDRVSKYEIEKKLLNF